jgi:hypothetical protein
MIEFYILMISIIIGVALAIWITNRNGGQQ